MNFTFSAQKKNVFHIKFAGVLDQYVGEMHCIN